MDARELLRLVAENADKDPHHLATVIAAAQKEADAEIADAAGVLEVAQAIREAP